METMGSRLRQLRKEKNLTLDEAAEPVEMDKGNLSRLERDLQENVMAKTLKKLAELYDSSLDYIMFGSKDLNTDLTPELKEFVDKSNIEYLQIGLKAKEEGLDPEDAKKIIEVLSNQVK